MLAGPAALCRPHRERSRAHPRGKPGFLTHEDRLLRETDSLLEGQGFEPSVPREISDAFESAPAMQAAAIHPVELGHRLRCRTALMLKPTPTGMGEGARSR